MRTSLPADLADCVRERQLDGWFACRMGSLLLALTVVSVMPAMAANESANESPPRGESDSGGFYALFVNGAPQEDFVFVILDTAMRAYLAEKDFLSLGLVVTVPAVARAGLAVVPLFGLDGLSARIDTNRKMLMLDVRPDWYAPTRLNLAAPRWAKALPAESGALLNYAVQVTHAADTPVAFGSSQGLSLFGPVGLLQVLTAVTSSRPAGSRFSRLGTTFFRDDEDRLTTLTVGDSVLAPGVGVPALRYGGISYQRNFGLQPGFSTLASPAIFDAARLPSTLEFFLNDRRIGTPLAVAPGPFEISGLPTVDTAGQVKVVIRDALNNERVVSIPYLRSPRLYREGVYAFSYTSGWLRPELDRYRTPFLATAQRYGVTPWLTLDAGATASAAGSSLGAGATFPVARNVIGNLSAAASRAEARSGRQVGGDVQWLGGRSSAGISASRASPEYRLLGDTDFSQSRLRDDIRLFASTVIGPALGSVSVSYGRLSTWGGETRSVASLGWSKSFAHFNLSLNALRSQTGTMTLLVLSLPLWGRGFISSSAQRQGRDLALRSDYSSEPVTDQGIAYRLGWAGNYPEQGAKQIDYYAAIDARSPVGEHGIEVDERSGQPSWLARTSGSIGLLSGRTFWGPPISSGFALVSTGDASGVPIYRWNLPVAVSDSRGLALVTNLMPYQENLLALKPEEVPFEFRITSTELTAVPRSRGGVFVEFPTFREHAALVVLQLPDRQPLPAGAGVTVRQTGETASVGLRGETFLQNLPERAEIVVRSGRRSCHVVVNRPATSDPQPRLGPYTCLLKEE